MTRQRVLYTEADLSVPGSAFRLRDVMQITGLSRNKLRTEMERGVLIGFRVAGATSPWFFDRSDVASWWHSVKRYDVAC